MNDDLFLYRSWENNFRLIQVGLFFLPFDLLSIIKRAVKVISQADWIIIFISLAISTLMHFTGLTKIIDHTILATSGIALLTILIPLAIILVEKYRDFKILDNAVVLDYVTEAKFILIYIAFIFLPLTIWKSDIPNWILLALWAFGSIKVCLIMVKAYQWIKGDRFNYRLEYLKTV
ncbi:MAG: hypothetical protein GF315_00590, partial [candidate division Zixibacteria bacterium]|nr:hypothetical protein [candidate division Zixibacteria bacterium]